MKHIIYYFILLCIIICVSCINTKKITTYVEHQLYSSTFLPKIDSSFLLLSFPKTDSMKKLVEVKKINSKFIPAIFYWYQDANYQINIKDSFRNLLFSSLVYKYIDSMNLKSYMPNSKIILHIPKIHNDFEYHNRQTVMIPLLYVLYNQQHKILDTIGFVDVNYFVFFPNSQATYGTVQLQNDTIPFQNLQSVSTKKYLKSYIDYYKQKLDNLAKELVQKIQHLFEKK